MPDARPGTPTRQRSVVRTALIAAAGIAVLILLGRAGATFLPQFARRIHDLGAWGPAVFIAGYVVATVLWIPGSLLTLAAGAIFGIGWGTAWVIIGATLGACAAFLVARYVARRAVERRLSHEPRFAAIDRAVADDGLRIVLLLRLSPVVPFTMLNYLLGATRVRFTDFLMASVGMLPGTLLYVYSGKVAGDVAAAAGGVSPTRGAGYYAVLGLGLIATLAVTVLITRVARTALRDAVVAPPESAIDSASAHTARGP